ncbi:division/cell wall cluster transcriptional repressor MraZ [Chloroflexia bacterium SDU3-3]|nr:division/cell wall cluster transcriptional repressor MraZ [Chloroflexia bacterium SDU3-3]
MFLGEYAHTIDDKGRLAVPARFREQLGEGLVVTRGFEHCLMAFPIAYFERLAAQVSGLSLGSAEARDMRRLLFSGASDMPLDKQGRINIPANLREYAGLKDKDTAVIAGMHTHFEIWSAERWQQVLDGLDVNGGAIAGKLAELGM